MLSSSWWPIFLAGAHMIYVAYRYPSGVVSKLFIFLFVHAFHTADRILHDLAVTMAVAGISGVDNTIAHST